MTGHWYYEPEGIRKCLRVEPSRDAVARGRRDGCFSAVRQGREYAAHRKGQQMLWSPRIPKIPQHIGAKLRRRAFQHGTPGPGSVPHVLRARTKASFCYLIITPSRLNALKPSLYSHSTEQKNGGFDQVDKADFSKHLRPSISIFCMAPVANVAEEAKSRADSSPPTVRPSDSSPSHTS
ncbi:unnamed protein product [Diplocarpon coronariae]